MVKRFWSQSLAQTAELFAEPRFIPEELRTDFTRLTGIQILAVQRPPAFSILNDPDTGIRLPNARNQAESRKHISISTIAKQLRELRPYCVITYDQSDYRHLGLDRKEQRQAKMRSLADDGFLSFYYVSHAPFLFTFPSSSERERTYQLLVETGIPTHRFEMI